MTPLDYARLEVGVEESGGANRGEPFRRYAYAGEEPLPWCARFLRWCFENAGTPLPGNRWLIGSVAELRDALEAHRAILASVETVAPGDLVGFKNRAGSDAGGGHHVAIVEHVGRDTLETIDGNYGNAVSRVTRKKTDPAIWFVARWPVHGDG